MLWKVSLPRGRPFRTLLLLTFTLTISYYLYTIRHKAAPPLPIAETTIPLPVEPPPPPKPKPLPCLSLPGASDLVIILKTSAAELDAKLPQLLASTLKCYPNFLIYSDHTETHSGQPILDALENVSPKIKSTHPDFDLYRRLQKSGPDALADEEMWSADKTSRSLDKWKMLPIIHSSFQKYGSGADKKKWFVFIDMKSHFFQSNLLLWLNELDPTEPYFLNIQGTQAEASMLLDSGSFVLSHPAIEAVSAEYTAKKVAYEQLTNERATGHSLLRQIVEKARSRTKSLQMTKSWPMFHPWKPAKIDYSEQVFFERLWCYPTVFHEGLNTGEIIELWKFEQIWIEMHPKGEIMRHSDVFKEYILPRLKARGGKVEDWDNFSGGIMDFGIEKGSVEECMDTCVQRKKCVQYMYKQGRCYFSDVPKMGEPAQGMQSRWLLAKTKQWADDMKKCTGEESWA